MPDNRPNRYVENGRVVYRASSLGSCVKALVALGIGMTPEPFPAWLLTKFAQGVAGEPVVLDRLRSTWTLLDERSGWWLPWDDGQVLIEVPVGSKLLIRGHTDGVGQRFIGPDRRRYLVEVKCTTEDYGAEILRHLPPLYLWQISTYARALGLPAMLVLGIKNDDGHVIHHIETPVPTVGLAAVKHRVYQIESWVTDEWLPPCSYRQFPCPFPELCDDIGVPEPTEDWELEAKLAESLVDVRRKGA